MAFRREEAEKNREREQHNQHRHQTLVSVTLRLVTLPHQGLHIFQTKRQDQQVLTIMILISLTFNLN